jgi:pilus assembly protein TadC
MFPRLVMKCCRTHFYQPLPSRHYGIVLIDAGAGYDRSFRKVTEVDLAVWMFLRLRKAELKSSILNLLGIGIFIWNVMRTEVKNSRMVKLYLHSSIRFHGVVLN